DVRHPIGLAAATAPDRRRGRRGEELDPGPALPRRAAALPRGQHPDRSRGRDHGRGRCGQRRRSDDRGRRGGRDDEGRSDIYYNLLSGFQKSIRGSNVDAGLYYLARLLEGGDLVSICRRILVTAYEDIGLADPALCARVQAAVEAVHRLGLPEARIPLSVVTVELCLSPKS